MKTQHTDMRHRQTDEEIRRLFHDRLPEAPADEWFLCKVMNRLPDKPRRAQISIAQKLCYIMGAAMLVAGWGTAMLYTIRYGLTVNTLLTAATVPVVALFCIGILAAPKIKRALQQ